MSDLRFPADRKADSALCAPPYLTSLRSVNYSNK